MSPAARPIRQPLPPKTMPYFTLPPAGKFLPALLVMLLSACLSPGNLPDTPQVYLPQPTQKAILIGIPPDATVTPTAFQPLPPTVTNTLLPPATHTPIPPENSSLFGVDPNQPALWDDNLSENLPAPAPLLNQPPNQITILLLGTDQRPDQGHFRTDVMILVVINLDLETISMVSFPRDLYVYIPGWTMERINTPFIKGGFDLTAQMLEYNFGVRPDHYALVNFDGFRTIINTLGGIDVNVQNQLVDERTGLGWYTIYPGTNHMDGETALWYVRSRYTSNDFSRSLRQQEVLLALFNRMLSFDMIAKTPDLYSQFQSSVQSDLSLNDILSLVPLIPNFSDSNRIRSYAITSDLVLAWRHPYTNASVLLPYREPILDLLRLALNIPSDEN